MSDGPVEEVPFDPTGLDLARQIAAAAVLMATPSVFAYLPVMLVFSVPCGLFTAFVAASLFPRLPDAVIHPL